MVLKHMNMLFLAKCLVNGLFRKFIAICLQKQEAIAIVVVRRPKAKNAANRSNASALADTLQDFGTVESAHVAILIGQCIRCDGAGRFAQ